MSAETKTLTNNQLYALLPALSTLIAKDTPMKVTIKLRKTLRSIRTIIEDLDEVRKDKVAMHTTKDSEGQDVVDQEAYSVDMTVMSVETSDVEIHSIAVNDLPDDFMMSTSDYDILKETFIITE